MHQALATGKGAGGGGSSTGTTQSGSGSLATNDTSKAVTFPVAFASTPNPPLIQIQNPDNTYSVIEAVVDLSTLSTTGFTFLLTDAVPASGFKYSYTVNG